MKHTEIKFQIGTFRASFNCPEFLLIMRLPAIRKLFRLMFAAGLNIEQIAAIDEAIDTLCKIDALNKSEKAKYAKCKQYFNAAKEKAGIKA